MITKISSDADLITGRRSARNTAKNSKNSVTYTRIFVKTAIFLLQLAWNDMFIKLAKLCWDGSKMILCCPWWHTRGLNPLLSAFSKFRCQSYLAQNQNPLCKTSHTEHARST